MLALLLGVATNAGAVAFAEVRIKHVTMGSYLLSDPADQTITSSVDTDEVLASVTAGPAPNVQMDNQVSFAFAGAPVGTARFIEVTYILTAWDEGLVASGPLSNLCAQSTPHFSTPLFCVTSLNGYEVAGAELVMWYVDPQQVPAGSFLSPAVVSLQTHDDAVADRFSASGVARAEVWGASFGPFLSNTAYAFADGSAVGPVPEPETYAILVAGLALLGWRRLVEKARSNQERSQRARRRFESRGRSFL
jgi:PEP-CTERM motif